MGGRGGGSRRGCARGVSSASRRKRRAQATGGEDSGDESPPRVRATEWQPDCCPGGGFGQGANPRRLWLQGGGVGRERAALLWQPRGLRSLHGATAFPCQGHGDL